MKRKSIFICVIFAAAFFVVAGFMYWRIGLAMKIDDKLQAIHAAGLLTSGQALNAYYPAVPESENAALVMTQAFALLQNFPDSRSNDVLHFKTLPPGQRLSHEQKQIFADYVEMNAGALAKMREAVELPESRYPVDYTPGPNTLLPHLSKLHDLAEVVRYKSLFDSESGNPTDAATAIENLLGMAHTLDKEPDTIAQLVRISLIAMAKISLEHCLNVTNLQERQLVALVSVFSTAEKTNLTAKSLVGELAINVPVFQSVRSNAKSAAELVKGAKDAGEIFSTAALDSRLIRFPRFYQTVGFWDRDFLYYLNVMQTNIALVNSPSPQSLIAAGDLKKADEEAYQNHYYLSKLFMEALDRAIIKEVEATAYLRISTAAIAVEHFRLTHKRLPENLNDLVPQFISAVPADPFDGKPLRYRRLAKGYVVYSIGEDGHDDGGREKPLDWKSADKTSCDITFTVERGRPVLK